MTGREYYEFCTDYLRALKTAEWNVSNNAMSGRTKALNKGEKKLKEILDKEIRNIDFDIDGCFVDEV